MNQDGASVTNDQAKAFREQALQVINASLEETPTQHPLDVPRIFEYDRPTLGGTVPLNLYRAVRLLALREVLGSKIANAVLAVSGKSVAQKMGIKSISDLVGVLRDFSIGKFDIEKETSDSLILVATECATCSGAPNIGEPLCSFETGLIAGGLESAFGKPVKVVETQCWGLGDKVCRWETRKASKHNGSDDQLEFMMTLANKAALTMENSVAVRQKNHELREAYHQLRESERLKKDLTAMIVHDMRTPLTAVIGSIETLTEMMEQRLAPQEEEILKISLSSGHTLLQMINDLLDVSKLEEHKLTLRKHPASMSRLVEQALSQVGILTMRKKLELKVEVPPNLPDLSVDKDRIVRVLVNLLANAVQHTQSGGRISVCASCGGGMINISVSDTGEGIPKEYHSKIFDKFVQAESHKTRKRSSSGLGLTFCKLVIEAHGGRIWVDSAPGVGSVFTFTLPLD